MNPRPELLRRLIDAARRLDPSSLRGGTLQPYREALLVLRARRVSYDRVAELLTRNGISISASAVGTFCRRHFTAEDIAQARKALDTEPTSTARPLSILTTPAAPAPGAPAAGSSRPYLGPRGPKIARDEF
jgi:hypothetical protein